MKTLRAYIITRMLLTIPMLFVLVTLVFFVVRIMPGDPVEAMLRPGVPKEYKDQIKHNLGLDRPLFLNFRGSTARVKPDKLFLQTEPGSGGAKALRIERGTVLDIGNRKKADALSTDAPSADWLQVAVPENFGGWVSPDQMAWMRQVNTEMTVLEEGEIEGTETWTLLHAPDGPAGSQINAIWGEPSGLLWFGTDEGVTRYSATGWDFMSEPASKNVVSVWSGRPAEIWFGTDGAGLLRFRSNQWTHISQQDGLASDRVLAIWGRGSRTVWAGTDRGVSLYNGRSWRTYTEELPGQEVRAIWGDERDNFWFGTEGGLARYDGKAWTTFGAGAAVSGGLPDARITALWGDADGILWVGTEGGLARLDTNLLVGGQAAGEAWTTYGEAPIGGCIHVIRGDASGALWVGAENGVHAYDGRLWTTYTTADGLADLDVRAIWHDV